MYIIAGLGNPGAQYENTRHNAGFLAIEWLQEEYRGTAYKLKHHAQISECKINGERVLLVRPQTYMNNSGESLREILEFYKEDLSHLIVIYDDIDLPAGAVRVRQKGSAGTHNGMRSLLQHLNSGDFPRVRVGIGRPSHPGMELADFVLGRFAKDELPLMREAVINGAKAAAAIVTRGCEAAMGEYNFVPKEENSSGGEEA